MISVITPSIRPEGLDLVRKALGRQTFREFEWILVAPLELEDPINKVIGKELFRLPSFEYVIEPPKEQGDVWALNKAYNKAIRVAKGDLLVSWQDYTFADPDALEKFWFHFQKDPRVFVSGVGGKYKDDTWNVKTWADPRERNDQGPFYPCYFSDIEWNFCAVPKQAIYDVGGFDESLDSYFGMDGYSVNDRANMIGGWDFWLDQTNKSYSIHHDRPKKWEEMNAIHGPYGIKRLEYLKNPKLSYL